MGARFSFIRIVASIILTFFFLDWLIFGVLIFLPPNTSSWDSFRWYNFEYHIRRLEKINKEERPLVLIVGSSIAKYSVQKDVMEQELKKRMGHDVRVELLFHAAMLPTDLVQYIKRLKKLEPELIVYITNPADLDLERYIPPWEIGPDYAYTRKGSFHYLKSRIPARVSYPISFSWNHMQNLGLEGFLSFSGRGMIQALRFRDFWWDPVRFHLKRSKPGVKSYLNYTGVELSPGLWRDGWTGGCLRIPGEIIETQMEALKNGLYAEVHPGLDLERFQIHSYLAEKSDDVVHSLSAEKCTPPDGAKHLQTIQPRHHGWQTIPMEFDQVDEKSDLWVSFSHVIDGGKIIPVKEGSFVYEGKAIRLPAHFGKTKPDRNVYLKRYRALEDQKIQDLSPSQYVSYYTEKIEPENWRDPEQIALWQMNRLRMGKYYVNWYDFEVETNQTQAIEKLIQSHPEQKFLLINNPENPLTLHSYRESQWYRGYLDFYESIQNRNGNRVTFADLSESGSEKMFLDPHHLTYDGMIEMAPIYAWLIEESLNREAGK